MNLSNHRRGVTVLLLATLAITSIAPLASADGRGRRYKGHGRGHRVVRYVSHDCAPRVSYVVQRSDAGAAWAGLISGFVVGAVLANSTPVYTYWDADCHRSFASLDVYHRHVHAYHHRHAVQVIEVPAGHGWDDYHVCNGCEVSYWGEVHSCD